MCSSSLKSLIFKTCFLDFLATGCWTSWALSRRWVKNVKNPHSWLIFSHFFFTVWVPILQPLVISSFVWWLGIVELLGLQHFFGMDQLLRWCVLLRWNYGHVYAVYVVPDIGSIGEAVCRMLLVEDFQCISSHQTENWLVCCKWWGKYLCGCCQWHQWSWSLQHHCAAFDRFLVELWPVLHRLILDDGTTTLMANVGEAVGRSVWHALSGGPKGEPERQGENLTTKGTGQS